MRSAMPSCLLLPFAVFMFSSHVLFADAAPPGQLLQAPPLVSCQNEHLTLQVVESRWSVSGLLAFDTRLYSFNGSAAAPGPTIVMRAGTWCEITVSNALPGPSGCPPRHNDIHCCEQTNLHTHGLHISPHQDNINVSVGPGENHTYRYDLLPDHLMGTHWYHAHKHGSTLVQLLGGLYGALLVEPAQNTSSLPLDVGALYSSPSSQLLILGHIHFGNDSANLSDAGFAMWNYTHATTYCDNRSLSKLPSNMHLLSATAPVEFYVVNGQYQPVIPLQPDDYTLLRFVHAAPLRTMELELDDPGQNCTLTLLARDGVFHPTPYTRISSVVLVPGTRADVAVYCPVSMVNRTVNVRSSPNPIRTSVLGPNNRFNQSTVFTLWVTDQGRPKNSVPVSAVPRPYYLADTDSNQLSSGFIHQERKITLEVDNATPNLPFTDLINGKAFSNFSFLPSDTSRERYIEGMCLDQTYEFQLVSKQVPGLALDTHPYHQHAHHFQVHSLDGSDPVAAADVLRAGEWRDVLPALANTGVNIRIRPMDFTGPTILHCHILQHEDFGMMGFFNVSDDPNLCQTSSDGGGGLSDGVKVAIGVSVSIVVVVVAMFVTLAWLRRRGSYQFS